MTAVLNQTEGQDSAGATSPASWPSRAAAFAIDVLAGFGLLVTLAVLAWTAPRYSWMWWVFAVVALVVLLAMLVNRVWLPASRGWSVGRAVVGIRVVSGGEGAGSVRLLLRECAHLLDTAAVFIGWLWPLWDARHRTFADLLVRTEVHRVERPESNVRTRAGIAVAVVALVGVAAAGLGYVGMYRQDQMLSKARAQLTEEGPRIVEQMLSYSVDSIDRDFENAQSLATDSYRPQLVAQQDTARKKNPTNNDYWAVTSALLPGSTTAYGSMLLAMQGQRGTDPKNLQFITATLRVDFRNVDHQWRVDNLTVLKRPLMGGGAQ